MSGGHFNYKQYTLGYIVDEIEQLILTNDSRELDDFGQPRGLGCPEPIISEFRLACLFLEIAQIYAQRVDWLVSGDDGEDDFLSRLESDLKRSNYSNLVNTVRELVNGTKRPIETNLISEED
jgi:hypothetical protein